MNSVSLMVMQRVFPSPKAPMRANILVACVVGGGSSCKMDFIARVTNRSNG